MFPRHERKRTTSKLEFDDARLFCDDCQQFYDNICPYHKQVYIVDAQVRVHHRVNATRASILSLSKSASKHSERIADLTCPDGVIIKTSSVMQAGNGVFVTKDFEKNTYFGPYTGTRHSNVENALESGYAWSIADRYGKVTRLLFLSCCGVEHTVS